MSSVEDHIEIQRLMYRYALCADRKDYAGFADVFCEDAVFINLGKRVASLTAIQDMMRALEKYKHTLHLVQNVLYEVHGDTAAGETYCLASHLFEDNGCEMKVDMGVTYQDRLRCTPLGWRIVRRDFNLLWSQTAPIDAK
jgi:ketosteroid isomerase-like protein